MKKWIKQPFFWALFFTFLLALFLRFYQLGQVPHGLALDEAAIGYNGYAILTTRRDEWLERLPVSFRSFGDYKAPLAIYLNGPFSYFFGSNAFAIRLPFALLGFLAVPGFALLLYFIFWQRKHQRALVFLGTLLLSLSPWQIHFSRLAFEAGLALSFLIWALATFYAYLRLQKPAWLFLALLFALASIYSYHSAKITVPLIFLFLLWRERKLFWQHWKLSLFAALLLFLGVFPFLRDAFFGQGLTRMSSTLFSLHLPVSELLQQLWQNFSSYFSLRFLLLGFADGNLRHSDGQFGVLDFSTLFLISLYLLVLLRRLLQKRLLPEKETLLLAILCLCAGLLPAIISQGEAHTVRSLLALPGYLLIATLALELILAHPKLKEKLFLAVFVVFELLGLSFYQVHYYRVYAKTSTQAFLDGYVEVFEYLRHYDKHDLQKIIFSDRYQHPYIYALLVNRLSPIAWQGGILNIFEFHPVKSGDYVQEKTLVVATPEDELPERAADEIILGADGSARFYVYLPQAK